MIEKKINTKKKQIYKGPVFNFLRIKTLTEISIINKNYLSLRIISKKQLIDNTTTLKSGAIKSPLIKKNVHKINLITPKVLPEMTHVDQRYPAVSEKEKFSPKFMSDLKLSNITTSYKIKKKIGQEKIQDIPFKNTILREKTVSKQYRSLHNNTSTSHIYYVKKTFVIKKNILKVAAADIFNWFDFLVLSLPNQSQNILPLTLKYKGQLTRKIVNTRISRQWKNWWKVSLSDFQQGWNQVYNIPQGNFLALSPYNCKTTHNIMHLSSLDYWRSLLINKHDKFQIGIHNVNKAAKKARSLDQKFPNKVFSTVPVESVKATIEKNFSLNSLNYPLAEYQRSNQDTCVSQRPIVYEGDWVQKGDLLADGTASVGGELALGKNILVAYMPWEGYNFEDAILISERLIYDDVYTSIHIERYEVEIRETKFGIEQITKQIPEVESSEISQLDSRGIIKMGSWVKEGDILVGKITPIQKKSLSPHEKLLYDIVKKEIPTTRDTSLRVPKSVHGRVVNIQILETENIPPELGFQGPGRVHIYIAEKRKIQVGDKMAGRHGNKGIISKILPRQDMPYLPDGTPLDIVLNPLGVPSRMNVGQVFECLLGLAGQQLHQQFKIRPFDEIYGPEASRSLVYSKLYEARLKTGQNWLFDPNFAGKTKLFDGRTGEAFDQAVTVGQAYMLKLVHLVDEKIHARSTGPYSLVTQQPLRGRSKHGGQRLGEMEVWALEGFGAAYTLQELLTVKSDDMKGRHQVMDAILNNTPIELGTPESFKVLIRELQSLCLDVGVYSIDPSGHRKEIDVMKLS